MRCKLCLEEVRPDCMLDEICVYCFYDSDSWESNAQLVTREEAILSCGRSRAKRKIRPRIGLPPSIREIVSFLLFSMNCLSFAPVVVARSTDASAIDLGLLRFVLQRLGFRVIQADLADVARLEHLARRLSETGGRKTADCKITLRTWTDKLKGEKLCLITDNFHHVARLPKSSIQKIERLLDCFCETANRTAWLVLGLGEMQPAFKAANRFHFDNAMVLMEEDICCAQTKPKEV